MAYATNTTNRRALLGAIGIAPMAALVAVAPGATASGNDTKWGALLAEHRRTTDAFETACDRADDLTNAAAQADWHVAEAAQADAFDNLVAYPCASLATVAEKIAVIIGHRDGCDVDADNLRAVLADVQRLAQREG